jgi:hypothetical protein
MSAMEKEAELSSAVLLALARQLRTAARASGRDDVARKVDDVMALIATDASGEGDGSRRANAVIRFLDGLGI